MLPISTLINQLNLEQKLWVLTRLENSVSGNSLSYTICQDLIKGSKSEEIKKNRAISNCDYSIFSRPIYNCILELYGLKAENAKDQLLSQVFYAIYQRNYSSNTEKINTLEPLFHEMKKQRIEQNSSDLLFCLQELHSGSPLQTVYLHLYKKYKQIEEVNSIAIKHFEALNSSLSIYLEDMSNKALLKSMILNFKRIRSLYERNENRTLEAFLNISKLILVELCRQDQLLKACGRNKQAFAEDCNRLLNNLPFGVSRFFLKNIFNTICSGTSSSFTLRKNESVDSIHNFLFNLEAEDEKDQLKEQFFKHNNIRNSSSNVNSEARKNVSFFSIPRDSWSISSTKLIG